MLEEKLKIKLNQLLTNICGGLLLWWFLNEPCCPDFKPYITLLLLLTVLAQKRSSRSDTVIDLGLALNGPNNFPLSSLWNAFSKKPHLEIHPPCYEAAQAATWRRTMAPDWWTQLRSQLSLQMTVETLTP